ncbi:MAG: oxaloacetate-decarboxylating malate dehydrogenase [Ilumatobacteraceae bacterium]|nr:oxaloacetate-decarboxylating malate dehydrogenase [Ilumatobacteraceae bacterium]
MSSPDDGPTGWQLLRNRYLNKGTAFTADERDRLGLHGLLPPVVESLGHQLERVDAEYRTKGTDLGRHIFLRLLQERNSVLFYSYLQRHLAELLPVVYTPTVGLACQEWSRIYRQEHGLYLSWPERHRIPELLDNVLRDHDDVDVIVVTDGERILGLGDLGAGGMGIPIGKLALYSAVGGIDPSRSLAVLLDVGTDNEGLLSDPLYLGWRHARVRGGAYDELVDAFVDAVSDRLPRALVQWEDFAQQNARRLLDRHRDRCCSFNDDIQGTAAVTAAAVRSGLHRTGVSPDEMRVVIVGAGSAGTGVADELVRFLVGAGMSEAEAVGRCWLVDRDGLLHDGMDGLHDFQWRYAHPIGDVPGDGSLVDVVRAVRPQALIGVSGQPGLFTEEVVRSMAAGVDRPIVLPLSNPTPRAEAIPADVLAWTDGRAFVGTGSPFAPVAVHGRDVVISQVNNISIFPGVGLGVIASGADTVTDSMITAAAGAVAELAVSLPGEQLLPPVEEAARCAEAVALAVAEAAVRAGVAAPDVGTGDDLVARIAAATWCPTYA